MPVYVNESLLVKVHDTNPLFPFHVGVLFPKCPDANVPRVQTLSKQPLITTRPLSHIFDHSCLHVHHCLASFCLLGDYPICLPGRLRIANMHLSAEEFHANRGLQT